MERFPMPLSDELFDLDAYGMTRYEKDLVLRLIKCLNDLKNTRFHKTRIEMQNVLQVLHGEIKASTAIYDHNGDVKK